MPGIPQNGRLHRLFHAQNLPKWAASPPILGFSGHEIKYVADHFGGFRARIPERSDFFKGPKGPTGRGPKAPRAPAAPFFNGRDVFDIHFFLFGITDEMTYHGLSWGVPGSDVRETFQGCPRGIPGHPGGMLRCPGAFASPIAQTAS